MYLCTACMTVDPKTYDAVNADGEAVEACGHCDEQDCFEVIPEHDDYDLER